MSHSVTLELPDPLYQKLKVRSQQANRSPIQIVQFRLSDEIIQHVQLLLDKEREAPLSDVDAKDLDAHGALGDFLGILRAKAQLKLPVIINH